MDAGQIDLVRCLEAASPGAVLSGQLVPLNNIGPLRVTYNWLYSALNCDPTDQSSFGWVINKVDSGARVSLSPQQPFSGMTLYASVRPDYNYTVQVQAPFSADWITAVGADEIMTLTQQGFLTISLQGLNGSYVCADGSQTPHDNHSGYLFHSSAGSIGPSSSFFVVVNRVFQDVGIPLASTLNAADIAAALAAQGASDPAALTQRILALRG
jgi:hypothetical protein